MTASVDALNYLRDALASGQVSAFVTQNPDGTLAVQVDVGPGADKTVIEPLKGPTGAAGTAQFPLRPQVDVYTTPADLPAALTNTAADIGKFWIIAQTDDAGDSISVFAYIWYGTGFRRLAFGTQGPPGSYGAIRPSATLLDPGNTSQLVVTDGSGTVTDPWLVDMELSIPEGPPGPSQPLANFTDVDMDTLPTVGQFLAYNGSAWTPTNIGDITLMPYVVPHSVFGAKFGIEFGGAPATIAAYTVPAQAWAWKPLVFGQMRLFEAALSLNPFTIGVEVLLGSPDPAVGTLVARAWGNDLSGVVTIMPHTSRPGSPTVAMTPSNSVGLVDAGVAGQACTLYVNIVNDGIVMVYDYQPADAQLFVLACPATT